MEILVNVVRLSYIGDKGKYHFLTIFGRSEFGLGLSGNIPLKEWEGRYSKYESTKLLKSIAHSIAHVVFLTIVSAPSLYDLIPW